MDSFEEEWHLENPEDCLEVMLELEALKDDIVLEWPEGVRFSVIGKATTDHFRLNIKQQKEWFVATGEICLDEKMVIDMQKLLALIDSSPGRFIEIQDGQVVALTNMFKKHLLELKQYSVQHKKGARFHPLAALVLEGITSEVGQLKSDQAWKDHVTSLKSKEIVTPQVPSTLQTDLRDYQILGYQWLWKLSQWGVGACLADDMGLGKTIQAMALLLQYASSGPSLVVAPTSVCLNWKSEMNRFAPTLNAVQLGTGDRNKQIDKLTRFDVMLCSYGLLQQEQVADLLCRKQWNIIILDEAQAIKNNMTKRAKAAMELQGAFKLVMTGTPIENHLGELWSLSNFINPGFLGTRQQFEGKFALPIEKEKDPRIKHYLKKMIQPVVLRRTKSQVLDELPPRTEIDLPVKLSQEEMAFYEAIRLAALERITDAENDQRGSRHLKLLAEITKLRQACCSSTLVSQDIDLPSSKLSVFGEKLEELLENNHKTLVFSQFVSHLKIIRDYLDKNDVSYQYLDGQTPAKKRKSAIDAFQAGIGDVFLISLKAGGTGLNLTAADFVVHMDPWWNPAVEDQASDRAHRIGQKRPVTIYRLIAQNTIEEKIVALHRSKRDLADSLLDGSDISSKMATNELLKLISEPIHKH
jgi:SNF2 family DNA or RNA helicase